VATTLVVPFLPFALLPGLAYPPVSLSHWERAGGEDIISLSPWERVG
jgi:hypothetical protein